MLAAQFINSSEISRVNLDGLYELFDLQDKQSLQDQNNLLSHWLKQCHQGAVPFVQTEDDKAKWLSLLETSLKNTLLSEIHRNRCLLFIQKITPHPTSTIPAILERISLDIKKKKIDNDAIECFAYAFTDTQRESIVASLIDFINTDKTDDRKFAATALGLFAAHVNDTERTVIVKFLINTLKHHNSALREATATALGCFVAHADITQREQIKDALIHKLNDSDGAVRNTAATVLRLFTPINNEINTIELASILTALLVTLDDFHSFVRQSGITTLGSFAASVNASQRKQIKAALHKKLEDSDSTVRDTAKKVIWLFIPDKNDELHNPIIASQDTHKLLEGIKNEAQRTTIIENLIIKSNDVKASVRNNAVKALGLFAGTANHAQTELIITALEKKLSDEDNLIRHDAFSSLELFSATVDEKQRNFIIKTLIPQLDADNWTSAVAAAKGLGSLAPYVTDTQRNTLIEPLKKKINSDNSDIRKAALSSLCGLLFYAKDFDFSTLFTIEKELEFNDLILLLIAQSHPHVRISKHENNSNGTSNGFLQSWLQTPTQNTRNNTNTLSANKPTI